jgi:alpha-glucuronidase
MLVIRGSINGIQGELRFEPRTNWLKFTADGSDVWGVDASSMSMTVEFDDRRIRVAGRLLENISSPYLSYGSGTETYTVPAGMAKLSGEAHSPGVAPARQSGAGSSAAASTWTQGHTPSQAQRQVVSIARKVEGHGSTLHIANVAVLILNLCGVAITLFLYLSSDTSPAFKFTAAVGLLFVATIVFLAYVGIEFVIQLGLLIAEWSKNSNSV